MIYNLDEVHKTNGFDQKNKFKKSPKIGKTGPFNPLLGAERYVPKAATLGAKT